MNLLIAANDNYKPTKLLRYCDLNETRGINYSRRHLHTLESENKFPKRVAIGENPRRLDRVRNRRLDKAEGRLSCGVTGRVESTFPINS